MNVCPVPWVGVPAYAQVVIGDVVATVLPTCNPHRPPRALRDAHGVVRVVDVDPAAPANVLVPDLADALVNLHRAGLTFEFMVDILP